MRTLDDLYKLYLKNPVITTDSRNTPKNSIFFALKGDSFDGNKFAINAINQGCIAAVVDDPKIDDSRFIHVDNTLQTLQSLARIHRRALGVKVVAITGTNGKTTTKELVNAVLSKSFKVYATKGNLNNHIGVPLTLLSLTKDIEIAIVEMGANHPSEIKQLCEIAEPDFGLITNIGKAHLEGFGSFEGVKKTKGELYHYIASKQGSVFYNTKNPILVDLIKQKHLAKNAIPYGYGLEYASVLGNDSNPFLAVEVKPNKQNSIVIQTSLIGNYNFENVLAAFTVGVYMGVPIGKIKEALEGYSPSNSRSQLLKTQFNTVILDSYNANPSSMELAITNFSSLKSSSKTVILGEMLELGEYSVTEHKRIASIVKSSNFDKIIFIGKGFENEADNCLYFCDSEKCSNYLDKEPIKDSLVLLKGSRGVKLEKVLDKL